MNRRNEMSRFITGTILAVVWFVAIAISLFEVIEHGYGYKNQAATVILTVGAIATAILLIGALTNRFQDTAVVRILTHVTTVVSGIIMMTASLRLMVNDRSVSFLDAIIYTVGLIIGAGTLLIVFLRLKKHLENSANAIPGEELVDIMSRRVVLYPAFQSTEELAEQYHRIRWYVPESSGYDVYLFHSPELTIDHEEIERSIPDYLDRQESDANNIHFLPWSPGRFAGLAAGAETVALWKVREAQRLDKLSVLSGRRFIVVDPYAKGTWEYVRYAAVLYDHMKGGDKQALRDRSKELLLEISIELHALKKAYVFGTGPSLERATEFSFGDGVRIVCNSIVRNPVLLDHIRPHFIAASDFVFHFGPSRYAAEFRRDLVAALKATGAYFLVPEQLAPIMLQHYPEITNKTIAVPLTNRYDFRHKDKVNVQLLGKFQVRSLDSVLNLLMLPVASTLAGEVYILGCDGRKPTDQAFWSHHSASQYSGLMKTVNDTHPGFFDVDYVDYYDRYCAHVASIIAAGEALGKTYSSLVPSYVPALAGRTAVGTMDDGRWTVDDEREAVSSTVHRPSSAPREH